MRLNVIVGAYVRFSRLGLPREVGLFCVFGGVQLFVDWLAFVSLSALGVSLVAANLSGRLGGALVGFLLNGRVTFRVSESASGWAGRFVRFLVTWLLLTAVSTLTLLWVQSAWGVGAAWAGKIFIEGALAVISFLVLKLWVYRKVPHGSC